MIRPMNPGDRQAYISMAAAFYASDAVIRKVTVQVVESVFDDIIAGSPHIEGYMLLDEAGAGAGYALLAHSFSQEAGGRVLWVDEIYIRPEYRGIGLAKELLSFVKEHFAGKVKRIRLDVEADNEKAIALYEKMGFVPLNYQQMIIDLSSTASHDQ